jgi:hypothetical protein
MKNYKEFLNEKRAHKLTVKDSSELNDFLNHVLNNMEEEPNLLRAAYARIQHILSEIKKGNFTVPGLAFIFSSIYHFIEGGRNFDELRKWSEKLLSLDIENYEILLTIIHDYNHLLNKNKHKFDNRIPNIKYWAFDTEGVEPIGEMKSSDELTEEDVEELFKSGDLPWEEQQKLKHKLPTIKLSEVEDDERDWKVGDIMFSDKHYLVVEDVEYGEIIYEAKVSDTKRVKGGVEYRGEVFPGFNKPKRAKSGEKSKFRVLAKEGDEIKVINFGYRGMEDFTQHKDPQRKKSFRARHKCDPVSKLSKLTARYWSCQYLWSTKDKPVTESYEDYCDFGCGYIRTYLDNNPDINEDEFGEYVTQHNKADRDMGELQDICKEEIERLGKEFKKQMIKEGKEEDIDKLYQDSLNDDYWKDISVKFPKYNSPDSDDNFRAVKYIYRKMKEKYPYENWNLIGNQMEVKILDGIT